MNKYKDKIDHLYKMLRKQNKAMDKLRLSNLLILNTAMKIGTVIPLRRNTNAYYQCKFMDNKHEIGQAEHWVYCKKCGRGAGDGSELACDPQPCPGGNYEATRPHKKIRLQEFSNKIWNSNGKLTMSQLDEILVSVHNSAIDSARQAIPFEEDGADDMSKYSMGFNAAVEQSREAIDKLKI